MALGTITLDSDAGAQPSAPTFVDVIHCAGDGAYPTGGTPGFAALFQAKTKDSRSPVAVISQDCGGYVAVYDLANDKLKVYYGDNNNASDGPLIEVPNATDLSGVTFRLVVLSQ